MEKQVKVREIKLNIENEFVLNLVSYLTNEENYVFVGNEHEIWFENISHPKIQLIYINDQKKMTVAHADHIFQKVKIISKLIKRKFLLPRVRALVLNACEFDATIENDEGRDILIINVKNAEDAQQNAILSSLFPTMANCNLNTDVVEIATKLQKETKKRANNEVQILQTKEKPIINNTYLILLVLFFVYLWFRSQQLSVAFVAINYGATYNPLIVAGEYWRFIVSAFMHLDPMHLIFNAVFIYRFGTMVENIFGKWRMIVIILTSAILSGLFGFAFSANFSLGASGVAYGFIGVLVFLGFEIRKVFMPLLKQTIMPMLIISVILSVFIPNIDHFGHLGGFIGGFLAATIVGVPKITPFMTRTFLTITTLVILISGLWINGVRLTQNHDFDNLNRALISQYIELDEMSRAQQLIEIFFGEVE